MEIQPKTTKNQVLENQVLENQGLENRVLKNRGLDNQGLGELLCHFLAPEVEVDLYLSF